MNINDDFKGISASSDHVVSSVEELQATYDAIVEFIPSHLRIPIGSDMDREGLEHVVRTMIAIITAMVIQMSGVVDLENHPLRFGAVQPYSGEELMITIGKKTDDDLLSNSFKVKL